MPDIVAQSHRQEKGVGRPVFPDRRRTASGRPRARRAPLPVRALPRPAGPASARTRAAREHRRAAAPFDYGVSPSARPGTAGAPTSDYVVRKIRPRQPSHGPERVASVRGASGNCPACALGTSGRAAREARGRGDERPRRPWPTSPAAGSGGRLSRREREVSVPSARGAAGEALRRPEDARRHLWCALPPAPGCRTCLLPATCPPAAGAGLRNTYTYSTQPWLPSMTKAGTVGTTPCMCTTYGTHQELT